ncbi:hypothetical protein pEaSNUABM49_00552 [Erwinia phage pEa_SNUABM_49]|nr:hypothetical protein pEaSNUABM49_00552 [Erwinia phage pEa_SNUABM_49]
MISQYLVEHLKEKSFKIVNYDNSEVVVKGKAFLSRAEKFLDKVKDPRYSTNKKNNLIIGG